MLEISRNNRIEIEREYLALLINKNDLFNFIQIKPEYLFQKENQKMLEYSIECFAENDALNVVKMYEKHKDLNLEYFYELLMNTLFYKSSWKEQLKISEEAIVKFYKEDVINRLNDRLKNKEINYEVYMKSIRKLDDIELTDNTKTLTAEEMKKYINEDNVRINFNHFPILNKMLQMVQGDFLIIGATTGGGKSAMMLNMMNDLMTGFQCIYFNMEMSKSTIYKRLVSINSGITIGDIENPKTEYQKELIDKSFERIEKANLIIEHKANDIKQIRAVVAKKKNKEKHTILFIDHLGLTKCDGTKTLYEQATEVAKQLRQMCLEYDCTIISAAQLNRSAYGNDTVSLNMLKDSGELENSASKVILLYKSNKSDSKELDLMMNVEIAKNRDGICGIVPMKYEKKKQIFMEVHNGYSS